MSRQSRSANTRIGVGVFGVVILLGALLQLALPQAGLTPAYGQPGFDRHGPRGAPVRGGYGPLPEVGFARGPRPGEAVVVVNGVAVIDLEPGAVPGSPLGRAAIISQRLQFALQQSRVPANEFQPRFLRGIWTVCAGDYIVTVVTAGDAMELRSDPSAVARRWAGNIAAAVRPGARRMAPGYRDNRNNRG